MTSFRSPHPTAARLSSEQKYIESSEATEVAEALGINEDEFWGILCDYDKTATAADRKHKQKINFEEFSIAVKSILIGYLNGKRGKAAENVSKKLKDEMDPILDDAIAKLEKKPKFQKTVEGEPAAVKTELTFKTLSDEEMAALTKLHEEQTERAKKLEEEAAAADKAAEEAKAKEDAAATEAANKKAAEAKAAAEKAKADAEAAKPRFIKDPRDGSWHQETEEEVKARVAAVKDTEDAEAAKAKAASDKKAEDEKYDIKRSSLLDAADGDPELAAKIAKKVAEAQAKVDEKLKAKAAAAAAAAS